MRIRFQTFLLLVPLLFLCSAVMAETAGPVEVNLSAPEVRGQLNNKTRRITEAGDLEFRHDSAIKSWTGIPLDPAQLAGRELLFSIGVEAEDLPESVKNGDGILVQIHYVAANGKEQFLRLPIPNKNGAMSRHTLKIAFPEGIRKMSVPRCVHPRSCAG